MQKFKEGDVVTLKSGGLPMTISNCFEEESVECTWFEDKKVLKSKIFKSSLLKKYNPPKQGYTIA